MTSNASLKRPSLVHVNGSTFVGLIVGGTIVVGKVVAVVSDGNAVPIKQSVSPIPTQPWWR